MNYKGLWITLMDKIKAIGTTSFGRDRLVDVMSKMELAEMRKESVFDILLKKLELYRLKHNDLVREGKIPDSDVIIRQCETVVADMAGYESRRQWIEKLFGG